LNLKSIQLITNNFYRIISVSYTQSEKIIKLLSEHSHRSHHHNTKHVIV